MINCWPHNALRQEAKIIITKIGLISGNVAKFVTEQDYVIAIAVLELNMITISKINVLS